MKHYYFHNNIQDLTRCEVVKVMIDIELKGCMLDVHSSLCNCFKNSGHEQQKSNDLLSGV